MEDNKTHLSKDQIIKASIDINDLNSSLKKHVETCPICRGEIRNISRSLETLSKKAKQYSPSVTPDINTIIHDKNWFEKLYKPSLKPAFTLVFATAIIISLFVINLQIPFFKSIPDQNITAEIKADEELFSDIEELESYALAGFTDNNEDYQYFEDGFLEFISPVNEQDSNQTNNNNGA